MTGLLLTSCQGLLRQIPFATDKHVSVQSAAKRRTDERLTIPFSLRPEVVSPRIYRAVLSANATARNVFRRWRCRATNSQPHRGAYQRAGSTGKEVAYFEAIFREFRNWRTRLYGNGQFVLRTRSEIQNHNWR